MTTRGVRGIASALGRDAAIQSLLAASNSGDAGRVVELLAANADIVNERAVLAGHTGKRSALHFAMNSESEAVVDALLSHGADPNVRDEGDNAMPLHFAAERGHLGIIRKLIEHGADPIGTGDGHELEVIGWATCFGRTPKADVVAYLLDHGAHHNVYSAVAAGATPDIRRVVTTAPEMRDRPMDRTNLRRRPLHLAVIHRQHGSLETLLSLGADPEAVDAAGLTPLDQAALAGETEMAQLLIAHGAMVRLPAAVALGREGDVERLSGEEPHALRPGGRWDKLILRASERAPAPVIEALLHAGASVHTRDDYHTAVDQTHGYTPLHAAAFHGNVGAVETLLRHGANPADREDKYWGTPAGWANHAGHAVARDLILEGKIDIFDAISFERGERLAEILREDPTALDRQFREYVTGDKTPRPWLDPAWTPIAYAVANGKRDAVRALMAHGALLTACDSSGRTLEEMARAAGHDEVAADLAHGNATAPRHRDSRAAADELISLFLRAACLDWRTGGAQRTMRMYDAGRLLERHPELARANLFTAIVCGDFDHVQLLLDRTPGAVNALGGPRSWPPILYLCTARLPNPAASARAVDIARLLLDRGADPNAFYLGGNADIHYTTLTCTLGRGEEQAATHPMARELTQLLLERGANPHDTQVLYNVFANHASRKDLDDGIVWLLELMREHSIRRGHRAEWEDPTWPLFDLFGAPSLGDGGYRSHGANFLLGAAVDRNLLAMAEWILVHGADPETPGRPDSHGRVPRTLFEEATGRGLTEMAQLLLRHGAVARPRNGGDQEQFLSASLNMDVPTVRALLARHPEYLLDPHALLAAVNLDRPEVVTMLLDLGVSPNVADVRNGNGRALHAAAYAGAVRAAAVLIERGADVDAREDNYHAIPLGVASWAQQPKMIELLGRYSRDIWELTHAGCLARLHQVLGELPELAHVVSEDGDTPLMWLPNEADAAMGIARLLLAHGADPTRRNARGTSAAEIAYERGLDDVAVLLASPAS